MNKKKYIHTKGENQPPPKPPSRKGWARPWLVVGHCVWLLRFLFILNKSLQPAHMFLASVRSFQFHNIFLASVRRFQFYDIASVRPLKFPCIVLTSGRPFLVSLHAFGFSQAFLVSLYWFNFIKTLSSFLTYFWLKLGPFSVLTSLFGFSQALCFFVSS